MNIVWLLLPLTLHCLDFQQIVDYTKEMVTETSKTCSFDHVYWLKKLREEMPDLELKAKKHERMAKIIAKELVHGTFLSCKNPEFKHLLLARRSLQVV
jgi:hypothetical protein